MTARQGLGVGECAERHRTSTLPRPCAKQTWAIRLRIRGLSVGAGLRSARDRHGACGRPRIVHVAPGSAVGAGGVAGGVAGGTLRSDLQLIVTRGRRSAVAHRGLAARWIRCMSKYWAVLSSPGVCVRAFVRACVWVGCCIVSCRAAPRGWAGAATGVRGLLWRACFDSSRKGWVRAA